MNINVRSSWSSTCAVTNSFPTLAKELSASNPRNGWVGVLVFTAVVFFAYRLPAQTEFLRAIQYGAGQDPVSVAIGDFNDDGRPDLAVVSFQNSTLGVLLGNGDGSFQTRVNYKLGGGSYSVAIGDFNGDGVADLATANFNSSTVSVLFGNGDGTFQASVNYGIGGEPGWVAVGDFNGDRKADLAGVARIHLYQPRRSRLKLRDTTSRSLA